MFTLMLEGQEDVTVADWLAYAEAAERLGYDGFFTSDHYFSVVGAEGRGSLDVWGVLCALAAVTKRIQLGTMVSPVTFRPPVVLAKLALVADGLSGGRVELGLGTGWHESEHKKWGLPFPPFAERLQMLAEQAEIIRRLTDGETLGFSGAHYTLEDATLLPRPVHGRLPIVFGGTAKPKVAALAARWADSYNLSHATPEVARAARERLDAACEAIGRDPASLPLSVMASLVVGTDEADYRRRQATANARALDPEDAEDEADVSGTPARAIERIAALREAGVERFFLNRLDHRDMEMVELVATEVPPARPMIGLSDVQAAAAAIDGRVVRTPLVRAEGLDDVAGVPVYLKAELLQHTGSFKLRGALNRMQGLTDEERARGVITVSAGNHAAAVARAGAAVGTDVLVLMARAASPPKVAATRGYGAIVDLESADAKEAFARMEAIAAETGRVVVHPFNDPVVIAGAGTVGLEIATDLPDVDLVIVAVGGGGLIAGISTALRGLAPNARLIGVQPVATATLPASLAAGRPETTTMQPTIADALTAPATGAVPLEILRDRLDDVVVLDEDELAAGFRLAYARGRVACEVAGSAPIGALAAGRVDTAGLRNVVCVVSGGNIDPALAARLLASD